MHRTRSGCGSVWNQATDRSTWGTWTADLRTLSNSWRRTGSVGVNRAMSSHRRRTDQVRDQDILFDWYRIIVSSYHCIIWNWNGTVTQTDISVNNVVIQMISIWWRNVVNFVYFVNIVSRAQIGWQAFEAAPCNRVRNFCISLLSCKLYSKNIISNISF